MTGAVPRLRFSKSDDLDLIRDMRECNPFEENMRHTVRWTEIAIRLTKSHQKMFSARAVRDRTDLRNTLSETGENFEGKSLGGFHLVYNAQCELDWYGTEEEYSEQNQLLEEIVTIAKDNGYKITIFKNWHRWALAAEAHQPSIKAHHWLG
ncbi:hypothetical protein HPB50_023948 [Hyalomma asiaticum]|uniref:Uncharacterized protein n=1 Tax=Hyalomma asiaticum TaxID=266040 RepID=A0ACB7S5X7_HYAAI|nr:hypothetical protein HPB50_023948 [Hyalomma asiaticum]